MSVCITSWLALWHLAMELVGCVRKAWLEGHLPWALLWSGTCLLLHVGVSLQVSEMCELNWDEKLSRLLGEACFVTRSLLEALPGILSLPSD